jgi:two-component system, NarL family, nitrate/nitrite response regulator NarL
MIRVLVVGGVRLYREGIAQMLSGQDGLTVVGVWSDPGDIADGGVGPSPDVVLVDLTTPEGQGAIHEVRRLVPDVPIVALGVTDMEGDVLACAEAGLAGYVTREQSVEDLVAVVESAARGELRCSPRIAASLFRRLSALAGEPSAVRERLTVREREVLRLIGQDLSNKEIARRLGIEVATVKNHVHNLLEKLNVHRRAEAARLLARSPGALSASQ